MSAFVALTPFRFFVYDGELLPNTWYAKGGGYLGLTPGVYVVNGAMAPFLGPIGVLLSMAGYGVGFSGGRRLDAWIARALIPVAMVGVVGAALPFITGSDWMPGWRFSVPYLPALAVTIVVGWMELLRSLLSARMTAGALLAVVLVAGLAHQPERDELKERLDLRAEGYASGHGALAAWLAEEALEAGDTVALMDIGIVGYRNPDIRILDVSGLTDRHIARSPGPFLGKHYDPGYVIEQQPEVIVLAFAASGDLRTSLPKDIELRAWTTSEERLFSDSRFQRDYLRQPFSPGARGGDWLSRFASSIGAVRAFEHHDPGNDYLLVAFERKSPITPDEPGS